jgi:microtubule-associated protein-like 6
LRKREQQRAEQSQDDELFGVEQGEKGDEFMSIKPWMSVIKEPSNYYKDPLNQSKPPMVDLQIDYVYGYRSKDCRNNIRYLKNGSIVYNAAALGVVLDGNSNLQRFFNKHDDDVLCLDIHPDGIVHYFIITI